MGNVCGFFTKVTIFLSFFSKSIDFSIDKCPSVYYNSIAVVETAYI